MTQKGLDGEEYRNFLGVNLRHDRLSLADQDLAKSINADLHSFPGAVVLRLGRTKQYSTALSDLAIRRIGYINSNRYEVAGTAVYRDESSILTGLSANLVTTLLPFRPLNDSNLYAFIADDGLMRKDDGSTVTNWGIAAPTATPAGTSPSGGSLSAGDYMVKFTYVRKDGSNVAHESSPSPASAAITASASDKIAITGMTASSDSQVTNKRIYRTIADGTVYLFDQEIDDADTTADSTQADTALGAQIEDDNDVPPDASWAAAFQEHVFLCRDASNAHYLWYSKRFRPESFPSGNYLEIGNPNDPLQCALPLGGTLGVFSRRTKYRVFGNVTSGFVHTEAMSSRGTPAPMAAVLTEFGVIFLARDGIFATNFAAPDTPMAGEILPLFYGETVNDMSPINWNVPLTFSAASFKNKYFLSYASGSSSTPDSVAVFSNDTKKWYFYDHPLRSLFFDEDNDNLLGGGLDGFVYILEDGSTDAGSDISLDIETKDFYGKSANIRKLFRYFKVDVNADSDTITAEFYIDGALKHTQSITGNRTKTLYQLPESAFGFTWRLRFTYTGSKRPKIYGCGALWLPLGAA